MSAQYPNSRLGDDLPDQDFGGQPASVFGQPAFSWINSVLRFLGNAYLKYNRVPYTTAVVPCAGGCLAGQVAAVDAGHFLTNSGAYVCAFRAGLTAPRFYGVWLEGASDAALCRAAVGGVVPSALIGLGPQSVAQDAGVNPATGLVRVAITGDAIIGTIDLQGNLVLSSPGMAL